MEISWEEDIVQPEDDRRGWQRSPHNELKRLELAYSYREATYE
jgi:hypothetical protein